MMFDQTKAQVPPCAPNPKESLAIVGIGCRFPGGVQSPESFWQMLCDGRDAMSQVPADRWSHDAFFDPDQTKPGRTYAREGGYIENIDRFDAAFFGISAREATVMDPQQRVLLECAWEALEDAGALTEHLAGTNVGVFVGISTHDYGDILSGSLERKGDKNPYRMLGSALSIAANRISHFLDLRGPSMVVDTACSSSLVALHLACQSLWRGESSQVLVGGANLILKPETTVGFSEAGMLAPDGRCKSFDASGNGYARAEGAGVLLLKPLSAAREAGDKVYAVVLATATNQDGHTSSIAVPGQAAQTTLIRQACELAGVRSADVQYVEAHGTGTPVGDPIELRALGAALSEGRGTDCLVGSVKSNIGHLEAAAGVAGLIKLALALHHGKIPPNLHFRGADPQLDLEALRLRVVDHLQEWPDHGERRLAGINSFGFGGANAHAILAADSAVNSSAHGAHEVHRNGHLAAPDLPSWRLIPLSARSPAALTELARSYRDRLTFGTDEVSLSDLAWGASLRRSHHDHRLAILAETRDDVAEQLENFLATENSPRLSVGRALQNRQLVFVYSGMGPQWAGMGKQLLNEEPVFRRAVEDCDRLFRRHTSWSVVAELQAGEEESQIARDDAVAQMAIFSVQVGLTELWKSWGVTPDLVLGHSAGETAAAHASGALSLEDAVLLCYHRSRLQAKTAGQGRMLAVAMSLKDAESLIAPCGGCVEVAAINGPQSVTLTGDAEHLVDLQEKCEAQGVFARLLHGDIPYHSQKMDPWRDELHRSLVGLSPRAPAIALVATATASRVDGATLDAEYWWQNVRQPVQFAAVLERLLADGSNLFLEVGPHPVLAAALQDCAAAADKEIKVVASLRRKEPERMTLLAALGQLYCLGRTIDWQRLHPNGGRWTGLPLYPWQRERFWGERPLGQQLRTGVADYTSSGHVGLKVHSLLGQQVQSPHVEAAWDNDIDLQREHAWLQDHRVQGAVVLPAAAYVELALAAATRLLGKEFCALEQVELERPLMLPADGLQPVQVLLNRSQHTWALHARQAGAEGPWLRYGIGKAGRIGTPPPAVELEQVRARCSRLEEQASCYEQFRRVGLEYGPAFQGITQLWCGADEALASIQLPAAAVQQGADFLVHPAILDAGFQALLGALDARQPTLYLPARIEHVRVHRALSASTLWCHARLLVQDDRHIVGDVLLVDEIGQVLVEVRGLRCQALAGQKSTENFEGCLHQDRWLMQSLPGQPVTAGWRLPSPADLTRQARPVAAALAEESNLHRVRREADPKNRPLIVGYFLEACRQLGCELAPGRQFSADQLLDELRVVPEHRRLVQRILQIMEEDGVLRKVDEGWEVACLPSQSAQQIWQDTLSSFPGYSPELALLDRVGQAFGPIFRGELDPLTVLFPNGSLAGLEQLYQSGLSCRVYNQILQQVVATLVRKLPGTRPLRVLELGAGTGASTAQVLPVFDAARTTYTFTDVSPQFVAHAQERFADHAFMDFKALDVERDVAEQGFTPHSYDVVLAFDVLHATSNLRGSLEHVKQLLAPGGLLLLIELHAESLALPIFGVLKSWWSFSDPDLRSNSPLLSPPAWCELLQGLGFAAADYVADVPLEEHPAHSVIVAQMPSAEQSSPVGAAGDEAPRKQVLILADRGGVGEQLAGAVKELGGNAVLAWTGDVYRRLEPNRYEIRSGETQDLERLLREGLDGQAAWTSVVYLGGLDSPVMETVDLSNLAGSTTRVCMDVVDVVRACTNASVWPRLWLITRGTQSLAGERSLALAQTPLWGLGRVLGNEQPQFRCSSIDLGAEGSADEVMALAREIWHDGEEEEIALRGQDRYVRRLQYTELAPSRNVMNLTQATSPFRLHAGVSGLVDDLTLRPCDRQPPGPGQIELEVFAAGLNFKDVAKVTRLLGEASLEGTLSGSKLGLECSGRVTAVGEGVTDVRVGDDVVGFVLECFASHALTDARLVVPKPAHLSHQEAATLPIVFLTAYYALNYLGRLQAGERVLIHAAAGGVGLAAVQLAQRAGAEVYATAGSPEKRAFLRSLGVQHVMDSRSLTFVDEIREQTGGRGVDVVLNSLSGAALVQSLAVLGEGGRFLELGKRDLEFNASLGLRPFLKQLSFFAIDLDRLLAARPELPATLFRDVMQMLESGELRPLPHLAFPISRVAEAFRTMLKAKQIGKVVISMREPFVSLPAPQPDRQVIRRDGTYLITGGLGGFGLATAEWLVERGARHLVLLGRSAPNSDSTRLALDRLAQAGAHVKAAQADVADTEQLARVLADMRATMPPLRGVFHAAMVLDDGPFVELNEERLRRVLVPKVVGAWNLHQQTLADPLECFVLFSSCASILGNAGQGNYVAANVFLDQLAHHRRLQGKPALAVNWGVVGDVGYVASRAQISRHLERVGLVPLPARSLLEGMYRLLAGDIVQSSVFRADWPVLFKTFPALAASPRVRHLIARATQSGTEALSSSQSLQQLLQEAPAAERQTRLQAMVCAVVAKVLGTSPEKIDVELPLSKLGLDSLMAMELATRVKKELQVDLPTVTLMSGPSVAQLSASLLERLEPWADGPSTAPEPQLATAAAGKGG